MNQVYIRVDLISYCVAADDLRILSHNWAWADR